MTREEITAKTGHPEQTDLAIELLLKFTKPALLRSAIRAEEAELEAELELLAGAGYVVKCNGRYAVNWGAAQDGWNLTPEQEAAYADAWQKCSEAESLLYRKNRVSSLLAKI